VLSGEVIIFQNEMLEIFKDVINSSTHPLSEEIKQNLKPGEGLKPRYVVSVFLEFLRSLLENSIP
jgi:hypothetical protein